MLFAPAHVFGITPATGRYGGDQQRLVHRRQVLFRRPVRVGSAVIGLEEVLSVKKDEKTAVAVAAGKIAPKNQTPTIDPTPSCGFPIGMTLQNTAVGGLGIHADSAHLSNLRLEIPSIPQ